MTLFSFICASPTFVSAQVYSIFPDLSLPSCSPALLTEEPNFSFLRSPFFYGTTICISILFGVLALSFFRQSNQKEADKFAVNKKVFEQQMRSNYAIKSVQNVGNNIIITFTVPRDGSYNIYVPIRRVPDIEIASEYQKTILSENSFWKQNLHTGDNSVQVNIGKTSESDVPVAIDIGFVIKSNEPVDLLYNSQSGVTANYGDVLYSDGVGYEPGISSNNFCYTAYLDHLPCLREPKLHLTLN